MKALLTTILILISTQAFAITGLSSMDRENGLLSDEAIEWINTHKPDTKSGKINHHYWWEIKGYHVAIHAHNIRKNASSADTAEAYIIQTLEDIIYEEEIKKVSQVKAAYNKMTILNRMGLDANEAILFLIHDYPQEILQQAVNLLKDGKNE